jgi:hypothetical protein
LIVEVIGEYRPADRRIEDGLFLSSSSKEKKCRKEDWWPSDLGVEFSKRLAKRSTKLTEAKITGCNGARTGTTAYSRCGTWVYGGFVGQIRRFLSPNYWDL